MGATIHSLFAHAAPELGPAPPIAHEALRCELRDGCVKILDDLARQMLDNADDALFRISESAATDAERRQLFDAMRVLRLERTAFTERFSQAIVASFEPAAAAESGAVDYAALAIQPTEELEERIAVGNLAARIEGLFATAILDLDRRLDAARAQAAAIPPKALKAASICAAFGSAVTVLRADFEVKLIVYKLFERVLCRDYQGLLASSLDVLERHGFDARSTTQPARVASVRLPPAAPTSAPLPWFDALLAGPALPPNTRQLFERLKLRLAQSEGPPAVDGHPMQPALAELIELATSVAPDSTAATRFDVLLESALAISAATAQGRPGPSLEGLVASLREQLREQRQTLLRQVRGEVARELELRLAGRELSPPMLILLRSGIAPLLALRLLKGGRDSPDFRDADALLDRLLGSLDIPQPPREQDQRLRALLLVDLRKALTGIGMSEARAGLLIDSLIASWAQGDQPAVSAARDTVAQPAAAALHAAAPALLSRILLPETWFRVFDPGQQQTRWLKLAHHYAAEDRVSFTGFDETTHLSLRASRLGSDLVDGRSEPVNPSPDARNALELLRQR